MLKKNKLLLLELENEINILRYHIELLTKLFPKIIKENNNIRESTASEINRICTEINIITNQRNFLVNNIKNITKK
jgi:hypothetical protein